MNKVDDARTALITLGEARAAALVHAKGSVNKMMHLAWLQQIRLLDGAIAGLGSATPTDDTALRDALAASVKLQSHYAELLNAYDDGHRLTFASPEAWMERLASLKARASS